MFAWVGSQFDAVLSTYVLGVVSSLMTGIAPIALTAMTIWVALYGWAVLRNEVPETVPTFLWKVFKIGLVLAFALQSGFYITNVADTANALATGVATTFLPAAADPTTISSPYALLDSFNDGASQLVLDLLKDAGIMRLDLLFAAVVCSIGNVVFLCIALFVVTLAKLFLTFVIAVGPLFVLCLAWRPTARFFDSWLSMVLNAVVLTWFAFFALGISAFMGDAIVQTVQVNGGFPTCFSVTLRRALRSMTRICRNGCWRPPTEQPCRWWTLKMPRPFDPCSGRSPRRYTARCSHPVRSTRLTTL